MTSEAVYRRKKARLSRRLGFAEAESVTSRSETGFVGLINLGNTCYMNSVLQALFLTSAFTDNLLFANHMKSSRCGSRLQTALAFLRLTQRSIYSPSELLKAARPPWFEAGRQQDCSEFLRFLLDSLHEQEKKAHKGLDVISEDDEERMSQDYFGSRTSLGSVGLKRWTTEENLSSELNSHSNSTDSGIQSVGETHPSLVHQTFGAKIQTSYRYFLILPKIINF